MDKIYKDIIEVLEILALILYGNGGTRSLYHIRL